MIAVKWIYTWKNCRVNYYEKKKIIDKVAVIINAPVNSMMLDEFDFAISLISIFYLLDWLRIASE